jgi:tetratricopeptide (TPR) repeat protein
MYEQAMKLSDNSATDYLILAHYAEALYWTPGKRDKARAFFEAAVSLAEEKLKKDPRNVGLLSDLASYYGMLGDRAQSLSHLNQVISQDPSAPDVMFRVAETYEQMGDRDNALIWVEKALANGYPPAHLDRYPGLKDLRNDDRFRRLRPQV